MFRAARYLVLACSLAAATAAAQECPSPTRHQISNRVPLIRNMINPNPLPDDFELPMPCGGKLILKHVCVPAEGLLDDLALEVGCRDCGRKTAAYMEDKRPAALGGAFTYGDLPQAWRGRLLQIHGRGDGRCPHPERRPGAPLYFFIAKYEITNFQWDAVMGTKCPGWDRLLTHEDPRPKTNVSWFEAVEFTRRYTEWLLAEHPEALPGFSQGRCGFIRLPTETEWEYAARGGHRVDIVQLNHESFFPLKNRNLSDYAVYTEANAPKPPERLAWVGSRCCNPLGLFDTAGNASEMVLEPFRFSVGTRLHGAAGGFLIKGGSYLQGRMEILPGRREEMPYFLEDGAYRSGDVGFRVVLSAIVTPAERRAALKKQWVRFARPQPAAAAGADRAAPQHDSGPVWKALFTLESLINYHDRVVNLYHELKTLQDLEKETIPENEIENLKNLVSKLEQKIEKSDAVMERLLQVYLRSIAEIKAAPQDLLTREIRGIARTWYAEGWETLGIKPRWEVLKRHVESYTPQSTEASRKQILDDIAHTPEGPGAAAEN